MLIQNEQLTGSVSSGALSVNTANIRGLCRHIIVAPDSSNTVYDISITNPAGAVVYERTSETGTLSELTSLPIKGIYTIAIANSSADEAFVLQLVIEE